jgi:hypothetical protein
VLSSPARRRDAGRWLQGIKIPPSLLARADSRACWLSLTLASDTEHLAVPGLDDNVMRRGSCEGGFSGHGRGQ